MSSPGPPQRDGPGEERRGKNVPASAAQCPGKTGAGQKGAPDNLGKALTGLLLALPTSPDGLGYNFNCLDVVRE